MNTGIQTLDSEIVLDRMEAEIVSKGPEYTLPAKLSDSWLEFLLDAPVTQNYRSNQDNVICSFVVVIFGAQLREPATTEEELNRVLLQGATDYLRELMCEYDYRKGHIYYDKATLNSILRGRDIKLIQLKGRSRYHSNYEKLDSVQLEYSH
ncbi:hypothetical protein Psal006b_03238 (plasmid) [Piscirickettsia salmonis]|uniref:TIR domain protein n=1 Tax=Piscirickettsia salmonis TaxID=1238 RepID=A0A1L6TI73_PISSA|nr:hypothetical protein [Piscirickettsia salmonis]ALT18871.1 hypothetical protein PSLF89_08520 [Piscirickettsia salmonis LF-89 = ATCC VR-1361]ALB24607.1 TIR domain protein [Piscirickettsia salmonis]ALY04483.1 hypothetical protein AWE47_16350 [Piscirickettsia salmonis]AMA43945.1 hypothetical protein AWJ11_16295 [Piscirickettsia salmonis]AOS37174.1 hypothetical protein AVM72_17675 [Piscirickettsia salmonis]